MGGYSGFGDYKRGTLSEELNVAVLRRQQAQEVAMTMILAVPTALLAGALDKPIARS